MMHQTKNKVSLQRLALKLSSEFNLPLITDENSEGKSSENSVNLSYEEESFSENLSLSKHYPENDFEFLIIQHSLLGNEKIEFQYSTTNSRYSSKTFNPDDKKNYLDFLYRNLDHINNSFGACISIIKPIDLNQETLEDLLCYVANKFKSQ